jgi:tetratricopeptide (TPR) repeat protein
MVRMVGWGDTEGARQLLRASGVPDDQETFGSVWYLLHLLERDAEAGLQAAQAGDGQALLNRAVAHGLLGRDDRADAAADSARAESVARLAADPEDPHARSLLALAHAALGDTADAKEAMGRARAAAPWDPEMHEREAHVHIHLGEHAEAIRVLAELLEGPSYLSPSLLRLDPRFDPLRGYPDFQALLN